MKKRPVEFYSCGTKIIGTIYLPDDYQEGTKLPCIIPCSGYTGVNAAYPALLSRMFTQHGYVCLGFDYRGWRPSEGEPGHTTTESEYADILSAYIFAQQQPEVQPDNIGLFGWGFSAPTVLKIAAEWPEIKAVGCGNGVYNGERCLRTLLHYQDYLDFRKVAREDLVQRVLTGKGEMISPYQLQGSHVYTSYRTRTCEPVTMERLKRPMPALEKTSPDQQNSFLDTEGAREAIEAAYGKDGFPPMESFENYESFMRIDSSVDVKKIFPRPIFIVHAIDDDVYPLSESQFIAQDIGLNCTTCFVTGAHNTFMFDNHPEFKRFTKSIVGFYDKALKQ